MVFASDISACSSWKMSILTSWERMFSTA